MQFPAGQMTLALPAPEPEIDPRFSVLLENADFAVVDKSGNLPCHASGRYSVNTLETLLRREAGFREVHFISRLDRETSGCVLVAKTEEAASSLGRAMMKRRFGKEYLCVVSGPPPCAAGETVRVSGVLWPVGDDIVFKYRFFTRGDAPPDAASGFTGEIRGAGRPCETFFETLPWSAAGISAPPGDLSLVRCVPVTGRTHQIRATLKGLGCDVFGDKLYGPDRSIYRRMCEGAMTADDRAALRAPRQALHSWRLSFTSPFDGSPVSVESPAGVFANELFF